MGSRENARRNEIDSDNRLQPRPGLGSGEGSGRITEAAGQYFRDLPRCKQGNGKGQPDPTIIVLCNPDVRLIGKSALTDRRHRYSLRSSGVGMNYTIYLSRLNPSQSRVTCNHLRLLRVQMSQRLIRSH